MATKSEPTGIKHARCAGHVRNAYTAAGWLCLHNVDGWREADMVPLADHLTAVRAGHRADGRIRPLVDLSLEVGAWSRRYANRPTGPDGEPFAGPTLGECRWSDRILSCQIPAAQTVEREPAPAMVGTGAAIGRPAFHGKSSQTGSTDVRLIASACDHEPPCANRAGLPSADTEYGRLSRIVADAMDGKPARKPRKVRAVRIAPPTVAPVAPVASIHEPMRTDGEPVALHPVAPAVVVEAEPVASGRPTCDRCGQTFRMSGSGYAWHRANRPDCAKSRRLAVVA